MPPGIRTPRAPASSEDELDDQILEAEPDEAETLMRERELGRQRQADRYAKTNDATSVNNLFKAAAFPLEMANVPIAAKALSTGQAVRESATADRQALAIEDLIAASKHLATSNARDAAAGELAGAETDAANAALRSAAVRSQIPDDLQGVQGDRLGTALPGDDTAPQARPVRDPSAVDDIREAGESHPYGRGFSDPPTPFDRHPQPSPGATMRDLDTDELIPLREITPGTGVRPGPPPTQPPLPPDSPTPSRLNALKKEWGEANETAFQTVRDLVQKSQAYKRAEEALAATGRTGEQIRGFVYPRAAQAAEEAMQTAKRVGTTATKIGELAEPLGYALPPIAGIVERMSKYGDFGENVRNLAHLNGKPVNRMSAAAEARLAGDRDLLGRLWQEGAVTDELAERLLGDGLEFEKPEEEPLLAQRGT